MLVSFEQGGIPRVADFVHGSDGLGNIYLPPPKAKKIEKSAAQFLVDKVSEFPGEVSILALGPLTNVALVGLLFLRYSLSLQNIAIFMTISFSAGDQEGLVLCKQSEKNCGSWGRFFCSWKC